MAMFAAPAAKRAEQRAKLAEAIAKRRDGLAIGAQETIHLEGLGAMRLA